MKNCYWQSTPTEPNRREPSKDQYDVLIIGGGYGGLSCARHLKQADPSLSIAVLEKDYVGFGASGRNGGFAMTLLGLNHGQLIRDAGSFEKAKSAHGFMKRAVNHVRDLIQENQIECEAVDEGLTTVGLNRMHVRKLEHECESLRKLGTDARFLDQKAVQELFPGSPVLEAAIYDPNCIVLHPFKLARGIKTVTENLGVEVCEGQGITGFTRLPQGGYRVRTASGREIQTKKLVVTTNAYSYQLGMFRAGIVPIYTYIVTTEPLTDAQWKSIGWDRRNGVETAFRLVHYMRPTKDGRILLGGKSAYYYFGHKTRPEYDEHEKLFQALREDVVKFFPSLEGIRFSHAWGGPIGSTLNFFPTVGSDPKKPDLFWALGCCGHGVSTFNYIGKVISDLMFEKKTDDTEVFFVNKKPLSLLPPEPIKYIGCGTYKNAMWWWDRLDELRAGKFF